MSVPLSDSQFAGFSRWNRFHANGIASPYQGEGRVSVFSFRLQNPSPSPPLAEGERREGPAP